MGWKCHEVCENPYTFDMSQKLVSQTMTFCGSFDEARNISNAQQAQAVIAGVYAVAESSVYVTLRIVRAADGIVISSADYALQKGEDVTTLLETGPVSVYYKKP